MTDGELVRRLSDVERTANGVPDDATFSRRQRAAAAAESALAHVLLPGGVRTSVLGPGWSSDVDLHVRAAPEPGRLEDLGWLPLDELLTAVGSPGAGRWAIVEHGEIVGAADLHATPPPDPVAAVHDRCRRRGEVRVREVLELRELIRRGTPLPPKSAVLSAAADAEASLGGDLLAHWRSGRPRRPPVALPGASFRRRAKRLVPGRAPTVGLALCGVDGSGKSTSARLIVRDLERLGIPASVVWTRPGMRIAWLDGFARRVKRVLREDPAPGVLRIADDPDRTLRSRRGVIGWTWAALVTRSFLGDVRSRARRTRGVVVFDRHLPDALVTLSFAYRGVDLRMHRRLVRSLMPPAASTFYFTVPAEVAVARKPDDPIGEAAIRRQLDAYAEELASMPGVRILDATAPPEELARAVLSSVLGGADERRAVTGEATESLRRR